MNILIFINFFLSLFLKQSLWKIWAQYFENINLEFCWESVIPYKWKEEDFCKSGGRLSKVWKTGRDPSLSLNQVLLSPECYIKTIVYICQYSEWKICRSTWSPWFNLFQCHSGIFIDLHMLNSYILILY